MGDLHQRLVAHALLGVGGVDRLARLVGLLEHPAVGTVGIVRNGQRVHALAAQVVKPVPEVFRVRGVQAAERDVRCVGAGEDDVAVQVLEFGAGRGVLVADERGELAGLVVALGGLDDLAPGASHHVQVEQIVGLLLLGAADERQNGLKGLADLLGRLGVAQVGGNLMLACLGGLVKHLRQHAQVGGVVGHRLEVQGFVHLHFETFRVGQRTALGEGVGVIGSGPGAE